MAYVMDVKNKMELIGNEGMVVLEEVPAVQRHPRGEEHGEEREHRQVHRRRRDEQVARKRG